MRPFVCLDERCHHEMYVTSVDFMRYWLLNCEVFPFQASTISA